MAYSSQVSGLVLELKNAGHVMYEVDQKCTLLYGLPKHYDVTVESVMSFNHTYSESVPKLIVRETRLCNADETSLLALVTTTLSPNQSQKWFYLEKPGHIAPDCPRGRQARRGMASRMGVSASSVAKLGFLGRTAPRKTTKIRVEAVGLIQL